MTDLLQLLERVQAVDWIVIGMQQSGEGVFMTLASKQGTANSGAYWAGDLVALLEALPQLRAAVTHQAYTHDALQQALTGAWELHAASEMSKEAVQAKVLEWFGHPELPAGTFT